MALRKPTRVTETVRLLAIGDDAIDYERWPKKATRAYATCEDLDTSQIPLVPDAQPVWFHVRGLSEHELHVARAAGQGNGAEASYQMARHGIVRVEGLDGWEEDRVDDCGFQVLTLAAVEAIPFAAVQHLSLAIFTLSTLGTEKKRASGSSPASATGASTSTAPPTTPAPEAASTTPG